MRADDLNVDAVDLLDASKWKLAAKPEPTIPVRIAGFFMGIVEIAEWKPVDGIR